MLSFVIETRLVGERYSIKWRRARWELRLRCGCTLVRPAQVHNDAVSLPPKRCRCQALPGCRHHVNTSPDGTGTTAETSP